MAALDETMEMNGPASMKPKGGKRATDRIGTERVWKLLLEFSIPAIISMVFNALYNIVDSVFLGQAVGSVGIAVTTLALPIQMFFMAMSMLAGQGGNALAAIRLGEGRIKAVEKTTGNTFTLLVVFGVLIAVLGWLFMDPVLALVGTTEELYEPTKVFVSIISTGFIFQSIGMGMNNFLRTAGKPNLALVTMVLGTTICIVLNYLFVMVLGYGVAGSASATIIGQAVGMVPVVAYFVFSKKAVFRLRLSCMKPELALVAKILSLGVASFAMQIATSILNIILNQLLVSYGALDPVGSSGALSAIGVAGKVNSFAIMPVIGVTMGAQTLIGYNYGAQLWKRVRNTFWLAAGLAEAITITFFILIHIIPSPIVNLFGVTGDLEAFTVYALQVMTLAFPIIGFQLVGSSYFQSSGQPLKAALLGLARQVLFLIPLLIILPAWLPGVMPITSLESICVAYPAADVLAVIITGYFIVREMKKLVKMQHESDAASHADAIDAGQMPTDPTASASSPQKLDEGHDATMPPLSTASPLQRTGERAR